MPDDRCLNSLEKRMDRQDEDIEALEEAIKLLPVLIERIDGLIKAIDRRRNMWYSVAGGSALIGIGLIANGLIKITGAS